MISETTNDASLTALLDAHDSYFLSKKKAESIVAEVMAKMAQWPALARQIHLSPSEVALFANRLNENLR